MEEGRKRGGKERASRIHLPSDDSSQNLGGGEKGGKKKRKGEKKRGQLSLENVHSRGEKKGKRTVFPSPSSKAMFKH